MATNKTLTPSTVRLVKAYGRDITSRGINWDQLIVFGSHAKGTTHKWSDINVCIEPHPFLPDELNATWDPLASAIRQHGIKV